VKKLGLYVLGFFLPPLSALLLRRFRDALVLSALWFPAAGLSSAGLSSLSGLLGLVAWMYAFRMIWKHAGGGIFSGVPKITFRGNQYKIKGGRGIAGGGIEVYGEQYYRDQLEDLVPFVDEGYSKPIGFEAVLWAEPDNEHDKYAVTIQVDGVKVGYLPRDIARAWSRFTLEAREAGYYCTGKVWIKAGTSQHFMTVDIPENPISQKAVPWKK
jgi:hypothetical protein